MSCRCMRMQTRRYRRLDVHSSTISQIPSNCSHCFSRCLFTTRDPPPTIPIPSSKLALGWPFINRGFVERSPELGARVGMHQLLGEASAGSITGCLVSRSRSARHPSSKWRWCMRLQALVYVQCFVLLLIFLRGLQYLLVCHSFKFLDLVT